QVICAEYEPRSGGPATVLSRCFDSEITVRLGNSEVKPKLQRIFSKSRYTRRMTRLTIILAFLTVPLFDQNGFAQNGPYKILKAAKVGGVGGFDYVTADSAARRLYVARSGNGARITVFNLDTLEPAGEIPNVAAHGVVISQKSGHGFA